MKEFEYFLIIWKSLLDEFIQYAHLYSAYLINNITNLRNNAFIFQISSTICRILHEGSFFYSRSSTDMTCNYQIL